MLEKNNTTSCALYLGLKLPAGLSLGSTVHYPIIQVVPIHPEDHSIKNAFALLEQYTHLIFTSKTAVRIFFEYLSLYEYKIESLINKEFIAVGSKTADVIKKKGDFTVQVPKLETAEGVVQLLEKTTLQKPYFFWPHSALSRDVITQFFKKNCFAFVDCAFYDTKPYLPSPLPELSPFGEIIFTSPSTVDAFIHFFGELPVHKNLTAIGPVTENYLRKVLTLQISPPEL